MPVDFEKLLEIDHERLMRLEGFIGGALRKEERTVVIGFDTWEHASAWWDDFWVAVSTARAKASSTDRQE